MEDPGTSHSSEKNEVAEQLARLVLQLNERNARDRRLVFFLLALVALAVGTVGVNLYTMIYQMSGDMRAMANAMGKTDRDDPKGGVSSVRRWLGSDDSQVQAQMKDLEMSSMKSSMLSMRADIKSMSADMRLMSEVMGTMKTMGPDMHSMSINMGTMTHDVSNMSAAVGSMTNSVGVMSTMTPAVQRMSSDTATMGRDMHWMMPFNWGPFQ